MLRIPVFLLGGRGRDEARSWSQFPIADQVGNFGINGSLRLGGLFWCALVVLCPRAFPAVALAAVVTLPAIFGSTSRQFADGLTAGTKLLWLRRVIKRRVLIAPIFANARHLLPHDLERRNRDGTLALINTLLDLAAPAISSADLSE